MFNFTPSQNSLMRFCNFIPNLLIIIILSSCGSNSKQSDSTNTSSLNSPKSGNFLKTNPAWGNFNELKKRPSPPISETKKIGNLDIAIHYGAPSVKGRAIWGDLVPYGEVWRTGADEATILSISQDILLSGTIVPSGNYAFFTIPNKDKWKVIINKVSDQWGAFNYDSKEDIAVIEISPNISNELTEQLHFSINKQSESKGEIVLKWEYLVLRIPISIK